MSLRNGRFAAIVAAGVLVGFAGCGDDEQQAQDQAEDIQNQVDDAVDDAQNQVQEGIDEAEQQAQDAQDEAQQAG